MGRFCRRARLHRARRLAGAAAGAQPPTLVSLRLHTLIGWARAHRWRRLHIGGLLLADRTVIEYLKPTAPSISSRASRRRSCCSLLALTGGGGARRRLWKSHRGFQATHVILGSVLAGCSRRARDRHRPIPRRRRDGVSCSRPRPPARCSCCCGRAARRKATRSESLARRQLVFGRNSTLIAVVLAMCAAGIAGLSPRGSARRCASR